MIRGAHHVRVVVSDLEGAITTYSAVAALAEVCRFTEPGEPGPSVLLRGVNGYLELMAATAAPVGPRPVNEAGLTHFCVQGRSIAAVMAALASGGFSFPPQAVDLGTGFLYAYGRSPDGAVVEAEGAPFATARADSWIGHIAFATHDLQRLVGFYAGLVGGETRLSPRLRNNRRYDLVTGLEDVDVLAGWVRGGNVALEFWQYLNPPTLPADKPPAPGAPGYAHVAFESDELEGDAARAEALGARLVERRDLGWALAADLLDPDGNRLRLLTPRSESLGVSALSHPAILAAVARDFDQRPRPVPEPKP